MMASEPMEEPFLQIADARSIYTLTRSGVGRTIRMDDDGIASFDNQVYLEVKNGFGHIVNVSIPLEALRELIELHAEEVENG